MPPAHGPKKATVTLAMVQTENTFISTAVPHLRQQAQICVGLTVALHLPGDSPGLETLQRIS